MCQASGEAGRPSISIRRSMIRTLAGTANCRALAKVGRPGSGGPQWCRLLGETGHCAGEEPLPGHLLGYAAAVQVRGDPAEVERPTVADDHAQVDVLRLCHVALVKH